MLNVECQRCVPLLVHRKIEGIEYWPCLYYWACQNKLFLRFPRDCQETFVGPGSAFLGSVSPAQDGGCWEPPFAGLGCHWEGHGRDRWGYPNTLEVAVQAEWPQKGWHHRAGGGAKQLDWAHSCQREGSGSHAGTFYQSSRWAKLDLSTAIWWRKSYSTFSKCLVCMWH